MKYFIKLNHNSVAALVVVLALTVITITPSTAEARGFSNKNFYFDGATRRATVADLAIAVNGLEALVGALLFVDTDPDTDLIGLLSDKRGRFTVFAPTAAAFENAFSLSPGTLEGQDPGDIANILAGSFDVPTIKGILLKHVIAGNIWSESELLAQGMAVAADTTTTLMFSVGPSATGGNSGVRANNATIVVPDVRARNGAIHIVDEVVN